MIRLSVNVNKVATLRNSRGWRVPSVIAAVPLNTPLARIDLGTIEARVRTIPGVRGAINFATALGAEHCGGDSRKIIARYLRTSNPEVLDATFDAFVKVVSKKPYPTLKGIQFLLDEVAAKIPQAKTAKPEQFVDVSLLQQLEKEGFFAEMAKRYP